MGDVEGFNVARADKEQDNRLASPVEVLEGAIREIKSGGTPCTSVLVLSLNAPDDKYDVGWYASNLKASEMLGLMEVAKTLMLRDMGYID